MFDCFIDGLQQTTDLNEEGKEFWFAVYPDYETGRKVQALRLKEGSLYIDSTLNAFVRTYLGIKKGLPDTQAVLDYRKAIKFFTKFDMERTIRSLNDEEYIQLLDAMKKHEGWREGFSFEEQHVILRKHSHPITHKSIYDTPSAYIHKYHLPASATPTAF